MHSCSSYQIPAANLVDSSARDLLWIDLNPSNSSNIFLMTDSFQTGGSERQFTELARALRTSKHQLNLGCLQLAGSLPTDLGQYSTSTLAGASMDFNRCERDIAWPPVFGDPALP